jgi:hypothetical protein
MKIYVVILLLGTIAAYAHLFAMPRSRVETERLS